MDTVRAITIQAIDAFISTLKWIEYSVYLLFGSRVEAEMTRTLKGWGVEINGKEPWDIKVHNPKFFARVAAYGTLGLGQVI